jgi:hypothetical protein
MHVVSQPDPIADQRLVNLWQVTIEVGRQCRQEVARTHQDVPHEEQQELRQRFRMVARTL